MSEVTEDRVKTNDIPILENVVPTDQIVNEKNNVINDLVDRPVNSINEKKIENDFSIPIIIAAALIFVVIIAWFESLRVWLEFAFNTSTVGLFNKALADMVYAISATVIAILIIFLIMKFWIKKI